MWKDRMMLSTKWGVKGVAVLAICIALGCARAIPGNDGLLQSYAIPSVEAGWIRNGEPLEYDGKKWYAVKDIENLLDSEVYQVGEYRSVQIFVDKVDVKPYERVYTKFAKGKFRYFELNAHD